MGEVTRIGVDLAKNVVQVHGVDGQGKVVMKRQLRREKVAEFFANLVKCLVCMQACGSAHYWARLFESMGHEVRLMAPQFVKPYVKTNKHDAADAEGICEAGGRPTMRFVPVKTVEQQAVLSLHRARQGFVKARTAQVNQIRGLLAQYGVVVAQGIQKINKRLPQILEDSDNGLPGVFRDLLAQLGEHLRELTHHIDEIDLQIERWHRQSEASRRLAQVPGIGPLTATALIASVGDGRQFSNARQMAAWLGLVPRQHSTGGKVKLLGISKRGDVYLRTLLIHGARAVIRVSERKAPDAVPSWLGKLLGRRHKNVAAVALANKNARTVWALLTQQQPYDPSYRPMPVYEA